MGSNTFQRKTLHLNICSCPHARLKSLFTKPLRFAKSAWKSLAPATLSAFGVSVPATQSLYERRVTVTVTPSVSRSAASRPGAGGAAASRAPRMLLSTSASCELAFCGHLQSSPPSVRKAKKKPKTCVCTLLLLILFSTATSSQIAGCLPLSTGLRANSGLVPHTGRERKRKRRAPAAGRGLGKGRATHADGRARHQALFGGSSRERRGAAAEAAPAERAGEEAAAKGRGRLLVFGAGGGSHSCSCTSGRHFVLRGSESDAHRILPPSFSSSSPHPSARYRLAVPGPPPPPPSRARSHGGSGGPSAALSPLRPPRPRLPPPPPRSPRCSGRVSEPVRPGAARVDVVKQAQGEGIRPCRSPPALHVRCTEEETEEEPAPLPARIIVVILSPLLLLLRGGGGGGPAAAAAPLRREGGGFLSPSRILVGFRRRFAQVIPPPCLPFPSLPSPSAGPGLRAGAARRCRERRRLALIRGPGE